MRDADTGVSFACGVIDETFGNLPGAGPEGIALKGAIWKKADTKAGAGAGPLRLGVWFFDGTEKLHAALLAIAREWTGAGGANVRMDAVADAAQADIRIRFATNLNQSARGSEAAAKAVSEPTMYLKDAKLVAGKPTPRMLRVVRHEFGHALGLNHEHLHFNAPFDFDEDKILKDYLGENWGDCAKGEAACRISIRKFITTKLAQAATFATPGYDADSVMAYPVDPKWLKSGAGAKENDRISTLDLAMVKAMYP